jgi:hypothetical protein
MPKSACANGVEAAKPKRSCKLHHFFNRYRLCWFAKYYLQPVERGLIFFVSNIGVYYSSSTIKAKSMIL